MNNKHQQPTKNDMLIAWTILEGMMDRLETDITDKEAEAFQLIDRYLNPPKAGDGSQQIIINLFG